MKQGLAQVELYNRATYSARNPGVRIQLMGISVADRYEPGIPRPKTKAERLSKLKADPVIEGWSALKAVNMIGPTVYQWDGGADQIIHGKWSRTLPSFDLRGAHVIAGASVVMLRVTIVADGLSPIHQDIAVKTLDKKQWDEWVVNRSISVESGAIVLRELATQGTGTQESDQNEPGSNAEVQLAEARAPGAGWAGWGGNPKARLAVYAGSSIFVMMVLGSEAVRRRVGRAGPKRRES
jgi:hypothetical protein